jgi:8-oxo-dGTP pyrophosphatase MutT (NUDIX family)
VERKEREAWGTAWELLGGGVDLGETQFFLLSSRGEGRALLVWGR